MKAKDVGVYVMKNNILRLATVVGLVLLIPLIGMQFSDEVNWSVSDFIGAGMVLFGAGLIYELGVRRVRNKDHRFYVTLALILGLAWLWIELAVGLFTNWGS